MNHGESRQGGSFFVKMLPLSLPSFNVSTPCISNWSSHNLRHLSREWSFHISIVELGECTWRLTSRDWNLKPCFGSIGMPQCQNIIIIDNPHCHPTILPSVVIHYPSITHYLSINTAILLMIIHYSNHQKNA